MAGGVVEGTFIEVLNLRGNTVRSRRPPRPGGVLFWPSWGRASWGRACKLGEGTLLPSPAPESCSRVLLPSPARVPRVEYLGSKPIPAYRPARKGGARNALKHALRTGLRAFLCRDTPPLVGASRAVGGIGFDPKYSTASWRGIGFDPKYSTASWRERGAWGYSRGVGREGCRERGVSGERGVGREGCRERGVSGCLLSCPHLAPLT